MSEKHIHLSAKDKPDSNLLKRLFKAVEKAYKVLHANKGYSADDITKYNELIESTNSVFSSALKKGIRDSVIPSRMRTALEEDVFVFSALKTHAQLFEASRLLTDAEGKIKSFEKFSRDIEKIHKDYNQNYLEAEYQFAVSSAQQAANWAEIEKNGDRYNLQYRTAGDDRVRDSHEKLEGITLPPSDKFWNNYYPPNGWRCRCVAVEVLKSKYPVSDSKKAMKKGNEATSKIGKDGKNRLEIFRFNPGKEKVIFPESHPYRKLKDAGMIEESAKGSFKEDITEKIKFKPSNIKEYTKALNIDVDDEVFEYLTGEVKFAIPKKGGAHYNPNDNTVYIPVDQRRKNSPWWARTVIYHEFGHAIDWQIGLRNSKEVKSLMDKYRKSIDFKKVDSVLDKMHEWAYKRNKYDLLEKVAGTRDAIMSLNPNYGWGHSASYWEIEGMKEAEFIAHAFENTFSGNEVFKKYLPELYKDTQKLIRSIKPK